MKIICTENNIKNLLKEKSQRLESYIFNSDGLMSELVLGREYIVYGLVFRDNCLWYQLCIGEGDTYPSPYPAELFKISNAQLSQHWVVNETNNDNSEFFISSPNIVNEPGHLQKLIDGDPQAEEQFFQYRSMIESEALSTKGKF